MELFRYLFNIELILSRYILLICGIFGWIGCIINIIVFLQKPLRKDVCANYILVLHIIYFVLIPYGCGKTVVTAYLTTSLPHRTAIFCKITVYLHHVLLNIARSYAVLACVDRYMVTSPKAAIRMNRSLSRAKKCMVLIPIFWFILPIHLIVYFDTMLSQRCAPMPDYAVGLAIYSTTITVGHLLLMVIFALLTLYNLHRTRTRVRPIGEPRMSILPIRRRDIQLMKMIFAEAILYVGGTMFFPAFMIYSVSTSHIQKTFNQYAIDIFLSFLTTDFWINLNPCSTFYLYFCVSTAFRKSFKQLVARLRRSLIEFFHRR